MERWLGPLLGPLLGPPVLLLLLVAGWAPSARAQLLEPGICPFGTPQWDWSEERFVADPWYEVKSFSLRGVHDDAPKPACTTWHFSPSVDGLGLHARLEFLSGGKDGSLGAFAQYSGQEKGPRFNLTFDRVGRAPLSMDVKLVATDYTDFALLWGCSEPNLFERKVASWVLSRKPELSKDALEAVDRLLRRHDVRAEKFVHTDQQSCAERASSRSYLAEGEGRPVGVGVDGPASRHVGEIFSPQLLFLAALLAFAAASMLLSLFMFSTLLQRRNNKVPVLPMRRQDISIATLGEGVVDYSRFGGGLGQGLTRKSGSASHLHS